MTVYEQGVDWVVAQIVRFQQKKAEPETSSDKFWHDVASRVLQGRGKEK